MPPEPSLSLRSLSAAALKLFKQRAGESGRMDLAVLRDSREILLGNLELTEKHWLRRAACLLFTDRPEKYIGGSWVKIGFFVTNDDLRYQDEVHGNLFAQVDTTLDLLHTKYLKAYITYHGIQRRETFLFPYAATSRGASQRDHPQGLRQQHPYSDQRLRRPDRLLESRRFAGKLDAQEAAGQACVRTVQSADRGRLLRAGYIEAWGRGIEKINRECREHGIEPPLYEIEPTGMMVTFRANPAHIQAAGNSSLEPRRPRKAAKRGRGKRPHGQSYGQSRS